MDFLALGQSLKRHTTLAVTAALVVACVATALLCFPNARHRLDNLAYDAFMRAQAQAPEQPASIIIDIDEKSLAAQGQWPWPRYLLAELIRTLCDNGVAAVGLDMLLSEPDRSSPVHIEQQLASRFGEHLAVDNLSPHLRDNDAFLARTLAQYPVALAAITTFGAKDTLPANIPTQRGIVEKTPPGAPSPKDTILHARGMVLPLPQFLEVAPLGSINADNSGDGILRGAPLVIRTGDDIHTSLALRTLMLALGKKQVRLDSNKDGLEKVTLGPFKIRVGHDGVFMPYYRGKARTFPYVSASDILDGSCDKDMLQGRIAFVGSSAVGLMDIRNTPVDANMPGVEVHATIIDNILNKQSLMRPAWEVGAQLAGIVLAGIIAALLFGLAPAMAYVPLTGLLLAGVVGTSWHLFTQGWFVSPVPIVLTFGLAALAIVCVRFWHEEQGRRVLRQAFSRYVAPEVVARIAARGGAPLAGEQKEVSVLFTDVRGFTSLSEKLEPGQVVQLLNRYFTPMTACVKEREGTLDKFVGDALMAFWNAPLDVAGHARKAVEAALAMQRELERLRPEFVREFGVAVHIGAGIHTGLVHVGNMGSAELLDYTCIGDNVNLASRLEGLCKRYGVGIVVSGATAQACEDTFTFRHLDRIRVKGKNQPVDIFCPLVAETVNQEAETAWNAALALYLQGNFAAAADAFGQLAASHKPLATACHLHLERCRALLATPPDHWDGVWTYDAK